MHTIEVPIRVLCNISIENFKESDADLSKTILSYIRTNYMIAEDHVEMVRDKIMRYFIPVFKRNWKSSFNKKEIFEKRHAVWLITNFKITQTILKPGRRSREDFEHSSKSTKRRKVQSIQESYSPLEIEQAFLSNLKASGKHKLANKIIQLLQDSEKTEDETSAIRFGHDETLALIEDAKLSRHQYEIIRLQAKARNADIYVPSTDLLEAKKECYPPSSAIHITGQSVTIKLQELLDHTVKRLVKIPSIQSYILEERVKTMTLSLKYGCDGASGQGSYKQKLPDGMISDESIFMVSMVPIMLESEGKQIWKNPHPGSTKLCIPVEFQYAKETPDLTRSVIGRIKGEISRLLPTKVVFGKFRCQVSHAMFLTMLDGKTAQNLSSTLSAATCHLCKANPSEMNDIRKVMQKKVLEENYQLGLSPLHAKIRCMTLVLHIAYRLGFCKWQAKTKDEKALMQTAKSRIQQDFRKEMGLIIDVPRQGSGNSNDGNTARRFFSDPELTAQITGVDLRLIERFSIILQVLSCGRKIDAAKFESYAFQTAQLYVELYNWYYMPSSVHKILLHGSKIIESFLIPIGLLSEEAQEARNKDFKRIRENHTRKLSRHATNTDLIHKLLISSDAYLAHLREKWKYTVSALDPEAIELLILDP